MDIERLKQIEHYYGTYASYAYRNESIDRLYNFCNSRLKEEFPDAIYVPKEDYHTTLIYSKDPLPQLKYHGYDAYHKVEPVKLSLFGPDMDILVLEIFSETMMQEHDHMVKNYKIVETYPRYRPHITLAKNFKYDEAPNMQAGPGLLETKRLIVEPLRD